MYVKEQSKPSKQAHNLKSGLTCKQMQSAIKQGHYERARAFNSAIRIVGFRSRQIYQFVTQRVSSLKFRSYVWLNSMKIYSTTNCCANVGEVEES